MTGRMCCVVAALATAACGRDGDRDEGATGGKGDEPGTCVAPDGYREVGGAELMEVAPDGPPAGGGSVTIVGVAEVRQAMCTTEECPAEDACCQTCTADLRLVVPGLARSMYLDGLGCSGTSCDYLDRCPYPAGTGLRVWGTFEATSLGFYLFRLEGHCALPADGASEE